MSSNKQHASSSNKACDCGVIGGSSPISLDPDHFDARRLCLRHLDTQSASDSVLQLPASHFKTRPISVELAVALLLSLSPGGKRSLETIRTVCRRLMEYHPGQDIRDITPHALKADLEKIRSEVLARVGQSRVCKTGNGAIESYIAVVRRLYIALAPYLGDSVGNPGLSLTKPGRIRKGEREVYTSSQLREIWTAAKKGRDPRLFLVMLNILRMTATRRMSIIGLNLEDINWATGKTTLRGKGGHVYESYISHQVMQAVLVLYLQRTGQTAADIPALMARVARDDYDPNTGAGGTPALLRVGGERITRRTADDLVAAVRKYADRTRFKAPFILHSIRHTTLSQIHENFDEAAAAGFAGHRTNRQSLAEATRDYVMLRDPIKIAIFNELFGPHHQAGARAAVSDHTTARVA